MKHVLALDQGTTSSRAIVFDAAGRAVGSAQREFRQIFPRQGWVEHDPSEIWSSQLTVAREALQVARVGPQNVAAIGIANQRETTLVWDRSTGRPICNAIVWQDRRTAEECDRLRAEGHEAAIAERTGLVLDPYFSATKLAWILDASGDARARAARGELAFGTVDSWLVWQLTAGRVHATDASNASRTMLYDIMRGQWDEQLLTLLDVPRAMLPRVVPSCSVVGTTEVSLFGVPIPIAGIAGDQQAALFGQRCVVPGMVKNTYGTGCFMLMHTGNTRVRSSRKLLTTLACSASGCAEYALEGSVFVGGAVVQWLRDGLGLIQSSAEVEALAASVPDNGGAYFVPALAGLGAPHWDPYARGSLLGLTRGTTRAHIARAALEAIGFQCADLIGAMQLDSGVPLAQLRVDGGAARNDLLMQFQADLLGVPVVRPQVTETTALGAAYLAGLAVGLWRGGDELDAQWRIERRFEPAMPRERVAALIGEWHRAVERARGWAIESQ